MTRPAFAQQSPKVKVCSVLGSQLSTLKLDQGPPMTAKVSANDTCTSTVDGAPSVAHGGKMWPDYTNIIYSSSGEVRILAQTEEVKITARKAIYFMEEFIIFDNAFPDLATRATWARKALLKAVTHMTQSKLNDYTHFLVLKKRLKEDPGYVKDLSSLVRKTCLSVSGSDFSIKARTAYLQPPPLS